MLVTEEWLLSDTQVRNPGLTRADYEQIFARWLGIRRTIWLGEGAVGDDTLLDARLGRRFGGVELFVEGTNLFNQSYQEVALIPMPGRAVSLSLAVTAR